jgi:methylenetetrahydrofolate dehydrogenase (NADP+)/methenyltetrahydrofolate cyclohydrolase
MTKNLHEIVKQADIVIGAVGKPEFIKAEWIKDNAIVVDAGYHKGGIGDIEISKLTNRVMAYTPVPGGVGPMTIAKLISQTAESAEKKIL